MTGDVMKKEANWNTMYQQLVEYKKEHGDFIVPEGNPKLQRWVERQRVGFQQFMSGEKSILTEERVKALEDIDFVWEGMYVR